MPRLVLLRILILALGLVTGCAHTNLNKAPITERKEVKYADTLKSDEEPQPKLLFVVKEFTTRDEKNAMFSLFMNVCTIMGVEKTNDSDYRATTEEAWQHKPRGLRNTVDVFVDYDRNEREVKNEQEKTHYWEVWTTMRLAFMVTTIDGKTISINVGPLESRGAGDTLDVARLESLWFTMMKVITEAAMKIPR